MILSYSNVSDKRSFARLLLLLTLFCYFFLRSVSSRPELVEYGSFLPLILLVFGSKYFSGLFRVDKYLFFVIVYCLIVTLLFSSSYFNIIGLFQFFLPLVSGWCIYMICLDKSLFLFFLKSWIYLSLSLVPLGFMFNSIHEARDFFGLASTPSGGIFVLACLFSLLLSIISKCKYWLVLVPLFLLPFLVSESFRYALQFSTFSLIYLSSTLFGIRRTAVILSLFLAILFLVVNVFTAFIPEYLPTEYSRFSSYLSAVLAFPRYFSEIDLTDIQSRSGIILRLVLLKYGIGFVHGLNAFFGWGPFESYSLYEGVAGRNIYSHNSLLEFVLSYGIVGLVLFCFLIFRGFKYDPLFSVDYPRLWFSWIISCIVVLSFNGKIYSTISFWIAFFVLRLFMRHAPAPKSVGSVMPS